MTVKKNPITGCEMKINKRSKEERLKKSLEHLLGPRNSTQKPRELLTQGKNVSITLHSEFQKESFNIMVEDKFAFVVCNGNKVKVPFVAFDEIDEAYTKSLDINENGEFILPQHDILDAYFERFIEVGLFME